MVLVFAFSLIFGVWSNLWKHTKPYGYLQQGELQHRHSKERDTTGALRWGYLLANNSRKWLEMRKQEYPLECRHQYHKKIPFQINDRTKKMTGKLKVWRKERKANAHSGWHLRWYRLTALNVICVQKHLDCLSIYRVNTQNTLLRQGRILKG